MVIRIIPAFSVFILFAAAVCFAQNNQTEVISFTTYFPAPYGVYTNLRLSPGAQTSFSDPENHTGTIYFNDSEQAPYVFINNGTAYKWERIASDTVSPPWHLVTPGACSGMISAGAIAGELCSVPWHHNITFSPKFTKSPHVMVFLQNVPDPAFSPCANNTTDQWVAYPEKISANNFTIVAGGSISNGDAAACNADGQHNAVRNWYTHAKVAWFAISD